MPIGHHRTYSRERGQRETDREREYQSPEGRPSPAIGARARYHHMLWECRQEQASLTI